MWEVETHSHGFGIQRPSRLYVEMIMVELLQSTIHIMTRVISQSIGLPVISFDLLICHTVQIQKQNPGSKPFK